MNFLPDWKEVLTKAWSVRAHVLSALLSGTESIVPLALYGEMPSPVLVLIFVVSVAGAFLRLVGQKGLSL